MSQRVTLILLRIVGEVLYMMPHKKSGWPTQTGHGFAIDCHATGTRRCVFDWRLFKVEIKVAIDLDLCKAMPCKTFIPRAPPLESSCEP